jgi:23S rRNA G2445 N2-methylase RlmL
MEITFYKHSQDREMVTELESVEITDVLYEKLAKSEFSQVGKARPTEMNFDGDKATIPAVALSHRLRGMLLQFLYEFLCETVKESLEKMGEAPSSSEYRDHTFDVKSLIELLEKIKDISYTHFAR